MNMFDTIHKDEEPTLSEIRDLIDMAGAKVGALEDVPATLVKIQETLTVLTTKVGSLESTVSALDIKVTSLDTKVSGLDRKISGLETRMVTKDYLDEKISNLRQDIRSGKLKTVSV